MKRSGFTLIEIVISLSILAIGLVGILSLFPIGFDSARRSVSATQATILAHEHLEELRNNGYPALGSTSGTFTDPAYSWTQTVTTTTVTGLRQVICTVTWAQGNRTFQRAFTTNVANR
ncbi:MAG: type II secretion system protein [Candidatus Omnitrophota bacterium]|jgi:type IV pilus assembly protein PilV